MADQTLLPDKHGIPRYKFRIQRIGIEIEGAWKTKPLPPPVVDPKTGLTRQFEAPPIFPDATRIKGDPSVKFPEARGLAAIGEVVSEPMIRPALWAWIRAHYPDVTNRTCGIHVHMSLRHELDYQRLIDRRFHDHMLLGLHRWGLQQKLPADHVFWPRLRGTNLFCQDVFHGDFQTRYGNDRGRDYHDHRYGMINFCWGLHKTLEVRVLPTFADRRMAIRAIRRVLNLTEEFLAQQRLVKEVDHSVVARMVDGGMPSIHVQSTVDGAVAGLVVEFEVYTNSRHDSMVAPQPQGCMAYLAGLQTIFPTAPLGPPAVDKSSMTGAYGLGQMLGVADQHLAAPAWHEAPQQGFAMPAERPRQMPGHERLRQAIAQERLQREAEATARREQAAHNHLQPPPTRRRPRP